MRLSEQKEYLAAMLAADKGDVIAVRTNLMLLLGRARAENDTLNVVYMHQRLGDVEAKSGNIEKAHSLHIEAIGLDPSSPLPVLEYAKSLLRVFRRPDLASARVMEAQALLASLSPSDDELPRSWYEKEIHALIQDLGRAEP